MVSRNKALNLSERSALGILTDNISSPEQVASFPESCIVARQKPSIKHNLKSLTSTSCDIQEDKLGTTGPNGVNSSCEKSIRTLHITLNDGTFDHKTAVPRASVKFLGLSRLEVLEFLYKQTL
jgi:hypothetical protein